MNEPTTNNQYVLITPARNEAEYIGRTIESVIHQIHLPQKWVIVSDSSTDETDEIVRGYAEKHPFIQLVRKEAEEGRNFSAKVAAFNKGYAEMQGLDYAFIGNLDADISFESDYFEKLLAVFAEKPELGIAGGRVLDTFEVKKYKVTRNEQSVPGAVQLFRRTCFEEIGGYVPLSLGGIDTQAEINARMRGWDASTVPELIVGHHRPTGTARYGTLHSRFRYGMRDYSLGYHPLFQSVRCVYRIMESPYFLSAALRFTGFWWAYFSSTKIEAPDDVVAYLQTTQLKRLRLK